MPVPHNATYIGERVNSTRRCYDVVVSVRYDPLMNTSVVHHMLLYGCAAPYTRDNVWCVIFHYCMPFYCAICRDCKGMGRLCDKTDSPHILFGWGRNAGGIQLPQGKLCVVTDIAGPSKII